MLQRLPEYEVAHERAVYKTVAVAADTKKIIQNIGLDGLSELRSMQKPPKEIEELLAAIIVVCKAGFSESCFVYNCFLIVTRCIVTILFVAN
jgi:dynein heavy chain, axonemal